MQLLKGFAIIGACSCIFLAEATPCCSCGQKVSLIEPVDIASLPNDRILHNNEQIVQILRADFASFPFPVREQLDSFILTLTKAMVSEKFTDAELHRIFLATHFAAVKHEGQKRKGPAALPYIIHPIGVAESLMHIGQVYDADTIIVALLHDTVEDTDTTLEEIQELFGVNVMRMVEEVTDDKTLEHYARKQKQIDNAPHKSLGAAQVKLADKLYNLKDLASAPPDDWSSKRIDAYFLWAQQVVNALPTVNEPLKQAVDEVIAGYWQSN